jgi:hypothetical protein
MGPKFQYICSLRMREQLEQELLEDARRIFQQVDEATERAQRVARGQSARPRNETRRSTRARQKGLLKGPSGSGGNHRNHEDEGARPRSW